MDYLGSLGMPRAAIFPSSRVRPCTMLSLLLPPDSAPRFSRCTLNANDESGDEAAVPCTCAARGSLLAASAMHLTCHDMHSTVGAGAGETETLEPGGPGDWELTTGYVGL